MIDVVASAWGCTAELGSACSLGGGGGDAEACGGCRRARLTLVWPSALHVPGATLSLETFRDVSDGR